MSNFVQIFVDPTTFIASIGTGNRLGEVALSLNKEGRALPHGTCPYVGIGGQSSKQLINYKIGSILFFSFMKVMEGLDSRRGCGV